jgi:DNA-binding GntR family transcriptional regulator
MLDRHPAGLDAATAFARDHLKDFAAQRLWEAIIRCELRPGETVSEAQLAQRFGLGKAPIRAGLARIAGTGLVIPIARQGYQVAPITLRALGEVTEMLRHLEPSLADVRLGPGDSDRLARLAAIAEAGSANTFRGAPEGARQALREMRHAILGASGNTLLVRMLSEVWDRAERIEAFTRTLPLRAGVGAAREAPQVATAVAAMVELTAALQRADARSADRLLRRRVEAWHRAMTDALLSCDLSLGAAPAGIPTAPAPIAE